MSLRLLHDPADVARARAILAGTLQPVYPRLAGTVLLLRDGVAGVEVFLMRRHAAMPFAPGVWAFPGGAVAPVDAEPVAVVAAVRETTEETGVALEAASLVPWARWVTPSFEPRRYDALFLLAALPDGVEPADVSGEADAVAWLRPVDALDQPLMAPTRTVLASLLPYGSVAAALAAGAGRPYDTVQTGWRVEGDVLRLLAPDEDGYPGDDPELRALLAGPAGSR